MNYFNDLADFGAAELKELIALARKLDEKPEPRALEGKVLSLLFAESVLADAGIVPVSDDTHGWG